MKSQRSWEVCIIGGGATGLGIAVDAASRGYSTILFERSDFAKGTSSRSTKLIHGGVRYLQQGNIKLVMEALKERGILLKNAPHLVKNQSFVVPNYKWWEGPYYGIGLKAYDWMAGSLGLGPSKFLSRDETIALAPTLNRDGLRGGVIYHDGQFDDARLAIHLAMTAADHNAILINHAPVNGMIKQEGKLKGILVTDSITGNKYEVNARAIINATGVFSDAIIKMDNPSSPSTMTVSQGIHLIFDKEFLPSETAIMIPRTNDKRVLFAVPWHNKIIAGTTDTPVRKTSEEPVPMQSEISFVLEHVSTYLTKNAELSDVKSMFAGLRPLVKGQAQVTANLSREHNIHVSESGLITINGGKWTTYRKMAEDVLEVAIANAGLAATQCKTGELRLHGYLPGTDFNSNSYYYGSDLEEVERLCASRPEYSKQIHKDLGTKAGEIIWSVKSEMCMTLEDALSRRTRSLLLNAKATMEAAPGVAKLMAEEMNQDEHWENEQLQEFMAIAKNYLPEGAGVIH